MHLLPTLSSVLALGIAFVVADLTMVHTPQVAKRGDFCGLWDRSATHDGYTGTCTASLGNDNDSTLGEI